MSPATMSYSDWVRHNVTLMSAVFAAPWSRAERVRACLTVRRLHRRRANRARKTRERLRLRLRLGFMSLNELRAEVGLPPIALTSDARAVDTPLPALVGVDLGCQRSHTVAVAVDDEGNLVSLEEA